jgi:hypothetical protein
MCQRVGIQYINKTTCKSPPISSVKLFMEDDDRMNYEIRQKSKRFDQPVSVLCSRRRALELTKLGALMHVHITSQHFRPDPNVAFLFPCKPDFHSKLFL